MHLLIYSLHHIIMTNRNSLKKKRDAKKAAALKAGLASKLSASRVEAACSFVDFMTCSDAAYMSRVDVGTGTVKDSTGRVATKDGKRGKGDGK